MAAPQQMTQQQQVAINQVYRDTIVNGALKKTQQIFNTVVNPANQTVVNISPQNVGLILGFLVNVRQNIAVAMGGTPLTLTPNGGSNVLSQIMFQDLQNNVRIQAGGWAIGELNTVRGGMPYLSVDTFNSSTNYPVAYGQTYLNLMKSAATIAASANSDVNFTYWVPLAYADNDLRGAVYANVVNATLNLQLTINPATVAIRSLSNWQGAVYCTADGSTAPSGVTQGNVTITVYQVYYDQLPMSPKGGVLLPWLDLQTIYDLKTTALPSGLVVTNDYPIAYPNFRDILATYVQYVNKSATAAAFGATTDVSYFSLTAANYTNVLKVEPYVAASYGRLTTGFDFPTNSFYFPTRLKPISTVQLGNMNLNLNPADVQSGAFVSVFFESFSLTNVIGQAASLPPG